MSNTSNDVLSRLRAIQLPHESTHAKALQRKRRLQYQYQQQQQQQQQHQQQQQPPQLGALGGGGSRSGQLTPAYPHAALSSASVVLNDDALAAVERTVNMNVSPASPQAVRSTNYRPRSDDQDLQFPQQRPMSGETLDMTMHQSLRLNQHESITPRSLSAFNRKMAAHAFAGRGRSRSPPPATRPRSVERTGSPQYSVPPGGESEEAMTRSQYMHGQHPSAGPGGVSQRRPLSRLAQTPDELVRDLKSKYATSEGVEDTMPTHVDPEHHRLSAQMLAHTESLAHKFGLDMSDGNDRFLASIGVTPNSSQGSRFPTQLGSRKGSRRRHRDGDGAGVGPQSEPVEGEHQHQQYERHQEERKAPHLPMRQRQESGSREEDTQRAIKESNAFINVQPYDRTYVYISEPSLADQERVSLPPHDAGSLDGASQASRRIFERGGAVVSKQRTHAWPDTTSQLGGADHDTLGHGGGSMGEWSQVYGDLMSLDGNGLAGDENVLTTRGRVRRGAERAMHVYRQRGNRAFNDAGAVPSRVHRRHGARKRGRGGRKMSRQGEDMPGLAVKRSLSALDNQLTQLFAHAEAHKEKERAHRKAYLRALMQRMHAENRHEHSEHLRIIQQMELQKRTLPLEFLLEKGIADSSLDYGLRVMQRTIKRLSMAKERAALRQWKHIVDEMNRVQSLIETNRIQLWEGFTVLSKSVRRMTKKRLKRRFRAFRDITRRMREYAEHREAYEGAVVIQTAFRNLRNKRRGARMLQAIIKRKLAQAKDMERLMLFYRQRAKCIKRHMVNKARAEYEGNAARVIQRRARYNISMAFLERRIEETRKRKRWMDKELRDKTARKIQRWRRCIKDNWALEVRFRNRKRRQRMIEMGLIKEDDEVAHSRPTSAKDLKEGEVAALPELLIDYDFNVLVIQALWRHYKERQLRSVLFAPRRVHELVERHTELIHRAARIIQRFLKCVHGIRWLQRRLTARRYLGVEVYQPILMLTSAATVVQVVWRNRLWRRALKAVFAKRRAELDEAYAKALNRAAIKVQLAYRKSKGRYAEFLIARAKAEREAELLRRERDRLIAIERDKAARVLQKLCRTAMGSHNSKVLIRQRQACARNVAAHLASHRAAWRIQVSWRLFLGRKSLRMRIERRRLVLSFSKGADERARAYAIMTRAARRRSDKLTLENLCERRAVLSFVQHAFSSRTQACVVVQRAWRACVKRYNTPARVGFRIRAAAKVELARKERQRKLERKSATEIQHAWRRHMEWEHLKERFRKRRAQLDFEEMERRRDAASKVIGFAYRRYKDRCEVYERMRQRREAIEQQRELDHRHAMAGRIQSCFRKFLGRVMLHRKFEARRRELQAQGLQQKRVIEAKIAAQHARDAQDAARVALKQMEFSGWKMGGDQFGQNYYYNIITGETSWEKPEGWVPAPEELWVKNVTDNGLAYYFNQISGETAWFPPCDNCHQMEGKKICFDCGMNYCKSCFEKMHDNDEMRDHFWRAADQDKDELAAGEQYCVKCERRKAERTSKLTRESYCASCWGEVHSHGWLKTVSWMPYEEFKKGWQEIKGRDGADPYYFNPQTGEETYEKPEELMIAAERSEHKKFVEFKSAAEKYVKTIEKLQTEKETLEYEKDVAFFEAAKAKTLEQEELETLRELVAVRDENNAKVEWSTVLANPIGYMIKKQARKKREMSLYRKQLLLSKKQRAKQMAEEAQKRRDGEQQDGATGEGDGAAGEQTELAVVS